jgi:hypothetical protein
LTPRAHFEEVFIGKLQVIEDVKIAAIQDKRKVPGIVEELLKGWLASRKTRR